MPQPDPLDAVHLRERVQECLDATLSAQAEVLAEIGPHVHDLLAPLTRLLEGGKRLRAGFAYWGYRAPGGTDSPAIIALGSAMEMFQAAALIHDDVMDDSDTRRGHPATHRAISAAHAERSWDGSTERFGIAGAILAGNLCLTWADMLYATCGLPEPELARARTLFDVMRTQLMAGQYIDVVAAARPWSQLSSQERIADARHVIRYKSAKYTIEHPLLIGATAAGATTEQLTHLSAYGLALGEAFQLRDDVLGVFGNPEETGKPAGDDLREGKRTVLIAHTLSRGTQAQIDLLNEALGNPELSDEQVTRVRDLLTNSGAREAVETDIARLREQAQEALSSLAIEPEAAAALLALTDVVVERKT